MLELIDDITHGHKGAKETSREAKDEYDNVFVELSSVGAQI
jgi:hypothetical protein